MTKDTTIPPITRRNFLTQAGLLGLIAWNPSLLLSCEDEKAFTGSGDPPFSVWEAVVEALKSSTDHFVGQRALALASGNPEKMFEFVKTGINLMPSDPNYFNYIGTGVLYGTSEALRCGMATPREKAEILKDMYLEAGIQARVVFETIPLEEAAVKEILFGQKPIEFAPEITAKMYRKWTSELKIEGSDSKINSLDAEKQAKQLSAKLEKVLKSEDLIKEKKTKFYFRTNQVPTVAFIIEGEEHYAHLFDPSVPFGQLHPENPRNLIANASPLKNPDHEVEIRIAASQASSRREEIELIKGTWKVEDLFGSQIKLQFLNNMTFEEQVHSTISQIMTYTPVLAIQNVNNTKEWHEERSVLGEPFNLEGIEVLKESRIVKPLSGDAYSMALNQVKSLEVKAVPKGFPAVSLQVYPRDAEGKVVERLNPNDFKLIDNSQPVKGILQNNLVAPRILILYDTSLSMPTAYRGEGIDIFVSDLMTSIKHTYPEASIKKQQTGSNIYTALYEACLTTQDVILYATDGHNGDVFNPDDAQVFSQGPPCIFLNVYNNTGKGFKKLAENTTATVLPAEDQAQVITEVQAIIAEKEFPPYTINYQSFDRQAAHEVKVTLGNTAHSASDNFTFTPSQGIANGNRLIGLYLEVKIGRERPVRRTLAGWDDKLRFQPEKANEMADAVHEMLLGNATLAFEAAGASLSTRASEYLRARLPDRAWYSALQNEDYDTALEELKKGRFTYPPVLLSLMQPLAGCITPENITYPTGIRIGILKFKPALYSKESKISFDYLPTSKYQSLTRDGLGYFRMTMEKTAQMAFLENLHFDTSTISELKSQTLQVNRSVDGTGKTEMKKQVADFSYWQEHIFRGRDLKLFDGSLKEKSYWQIHPQFGELYGILEDGTGGGGSGQIAQLHELDRVVKGYERIVAMMNYGMAATGTGGFALGVVAAYSIALVKLYAGATEAIIIMDAIGLDDAAKEALLELGCNVYKNIVYGGLGPVGTILDGVENLMTIMGKSVSFLSCP